MERNRVSIMRIIPLFGRKKLVNEDSAVLRNIYMTLMRFQRNHNLVQVKFKGDEVTYQSMILRVNPEEQYLYIDELFPKTDGFIGLEGHTITVIVKEKGMTVSFDSKILKRGKEDGALYYKIELPTEIDKQQRRGAFRIQMDDALGVDVGVELDNSADESLIATVKDISSTGVRLVIQGEHKKIRSGTVLANLKLSYGDGEFFICNLDVRNSQLEQEPHHHTLVGGQFINLNSEDKKQLEKFILKTQREIRRREMEAA